MEELLVMSCVVSGDIMGEACNELEVATEEALIGMEAVEEIGGRKEVCTWLGLCLDTECCSVCGFEVGVGAFGGRGGEFDIVENAPPAMLSLIVA